jgi:autotransporter-associated beta strand protein
MVAVCVSLLPMAGHGNTLSWSGGSSVSGNWNDSANWGSVGTPANGDTLIFGAIATSRLATTNNLSNLVLNQIRFNGSSGGFALYGNAFTLTNSIMATNTPGANTINDSLTVATADVTMLVSNSATLTLNGQINGTVGITKTGGGTLLYQNSSGSNPYSGTTRVNAGTLQLNVSGTAAFGGPLIIGDGSGTAATVRHLQSTEISDVLPITINLGGLLDLNGFSELISTSLALNSGSISTGTGTLTLSPNATITLSTVSAVPTINGNLNVGSSGTCTIQGSGYLNINAVVSGVANIVKNGSVNVFLDNANTFNGSFTANGSGYVEIATSTALGSTNGGTVINSSVQLIINSGVNVINENLTMNSTYANGAIWLDASAVSSWTATNITLSATTTISVANGSTLTLIGPISGPGGVTKTGPGTLTYSGNNGNTYTGPTIVNNGLLQLGNTQAGIPYGSLTITNATVRDLNDYGLNGGQVPITVQRGGVFDLNGHFDEFANSLTLSGGGTVNLGSGGTLQMLGFPTAITNLSGNGAINGSGYLQLNANPCTIYVADGTSLDVFPNVAGPAAITKTGAGTLNFRSANSYTGLTTISQGYLWAYNPLSLGQTINGTVVSSGATLVLAGSIGITNESLTLNGPGAASDYGALDVEDSPGTNIWAGPITLNADSTFDPWYANSGLRIIGPISGSGGVIKLIKSSGTLSLEGTTANTYAGTTTVSSGTLLLGKSSGIKAVPGPLVIDSNTTVRLLNNFQIDSYTTPVTMSDFSLLDLAGFNEWIGPLSIQGAQITSGAGTLYLGGNIVVNPSTVAQSVISGKASIWNQTITITNSGYYYVPDLVISANVSSGGSGGQGLIKDGDGDVSLTGSNSFIGPVTINRGFLSAQTSAALGNTNTPATVNNGGSLFLNGGVLDFGLKPLVLNGPGNGFSISALYCNGTCSWGGNITLNSDSTVCPEPGASLNLTGALSGPGGITEVPLGTYDGGTLIFAGSGANTYAGLTTVNGGTLLLNKTAGVNAVPGNLVVNGTVRLGASQQIADTADVMVNQGLFDLGAYDEYIDTLRGWGTVNFGSGGWIYLGLNNGSSEFDGSFTGIGYAPGFTVGKTGSGTFTMTGTNTFSAGNTAIRAGKMVINGYQPQSPVIVSNGATLGGSGTVGTIAASGNISPGTSPGILTSSNVTFTSSGNFTVELTGPNPGVGGYDQLNVTGTVSLANATLMVVPAFATPVSIGQKFIIINNDLSDAINGTFSGLAEGATITVGGYKFIISYAGGTGNDVVLTLTALPGAVAGFTVTSGNGSHGIDPNDCNNLSLVITNTAGTPMTGINATLSTTTEGVLITQPYATYPNIPANGSGTNIAPFQISTLPSFVCGNTINLQLIVNSSLGSFTMNYVLNTGESAAPTRFDNNTITNVPDIGTIESTNNVTSWSGGPITKVTVSLWLVAPIDSDLNLSLISPDGTTVPLSTANGAGANFGSGSADASRTTFDDSAATAITAGSPPFVGTFRPQSPLSAFIGTSPNGAWRLHIQDSFGSGSPDTLRNWSLFLSGTACSSGSGFCDVCMPAETNAITTGDAVQTGRWIGNLVVASCGTPKTWPGTIAGSFHFDEYSYINTSPADACVTVELQSPSNILATAYLNSFDPANITMNYLGDAGNSTHGGQTTFSCTVPAGATFLVVVTEVIANAGTQPYILQLSGLPCPPPTLSIQPVPANKARLYWPTWAGGYKLEATPSLLQTNWAYVTNEPIVSALKYNVTNSAMNPTNRFYRLHKP